MRKIVFGLLAGGAFILCACSVTVTNTCGGSDVDCNGFCRDLDHDSDNCGACGAACNAGDFCSGGLCIVGSCTLDLDPCASDLDCCTGICANGDGLCGCVNTNETGCGTDSDCCDPGDICSGGVCQ